MKADDGWPPAYDPAPFHGIAVAVLLTLVVVLAVGVVWVVWVGGA